MTTPRLRFVSLFLASVVAGIILSAASLQAQTKAPDTAVLTGAPLGAVTFDHKAHVARAGKCDTCHHASKPEKPMKGAQETCTDCHTKVATAPMKTKTQAAFHDPMAKNGTCVDCHQQAIANGSKKAPAKCADCHQKA